MILYKYFNTDTRVKREAIYLAKKGFNLEIINCRETLDDKKSAQNYNKLIKNAEIMTISSKERQSIKNLLSFWMKTFLYLLKKKKQPKILHAHDLTGLPPAILYKIIFPKIRVIYDSHELFPEAAMDKLNYFYYLIFLIIELLCSRFITVIIGASLLELQILEKRIKKPTFCLLNVPDLELIQKEFDYEFLELHPFSKNKNLKIKIVYSGEVLPFRGYDDFILAANYILKKNLNFEFWIIGDGIYLNYIKNLVKEYEIEHNFIFTGRVPHNELLKLSYECDIAVGLYENTINNNIMISNKIFEYMLIGIPFIFTGLISSKPYIKQVSALYVNFPINPITVSEKILSLYKDRKLQREISARSKALIKEKLNWNNESKNLIKAYLEAIKH